MYASEFKGHEAPMSKQSQKKKMQPCEMYVEYVWSELFLILQINLSVYWSPSFLTENICSLIMQQEGYSFNN